MAVDAWMLSSVGRRGSLVKFLQQTPLTGTSSRVVGTDASDLSAGGHLSDVFERVPLVRDESFVSTVLEIAAKNNVKIIIPTIDPEIEVYAQNKDLFKKHGVDVWVSTPEVARLGWDKWDLYNWLVKNDLPTIKTCEIGSLQSHTLTGPVVAKPRSGSSGIGVIFAATLDELEIRQLTSDYIVQEKAPGFEITIDFAVGIKGNPLAIVPRRRLEVRGGEVSKGIAIAYPEVIDLVRGLIKKLPGAYGALNVQVFYEPATSTMNIIEINPRFGGGYPLSHLAGANFFEALLRDRSGEVVSELNWKSGTLMLRYDTEVILHDYEYELIDV